MAISIGGVSCSIACGEDGQSYGVQESWPADGPRAVVHYKCKWASRYTVMQHLRGGILGGVVVIPHQYPPSPNLFCLGIGEITGVKFRGRSDGFAEYEHAIIPAEYGIPTWDAIAGTPGDPQSDPSGKPFTHTSFRASPEVLQPPAGVYLWEDGPDAGEEVPEATIGLVRSRVEITRKLVVSPYVPLQEAMLTVGSVNEAPVSLANASFPRGCLLFAAMNSNEDVEQRAWGFGKSFEVEYTLIGNGFISNGSGGAAQPEWNQFLATDGSWRYIETSNNARPYRYTNFWDLLP